MIILTKNLGDVMRVFTSYRKTSLFILLVLTTCICSGQRLMLGSQIIGKQTEYSLYSGKLVKPMPDATECVTLKTDDQDSHSWLQVKQSTWQPYPVMQDSGYCQNQVATQKQCSQIRSYLFQPTTRSSSNRYRTEWIDRKQSSLTGYQLQNSLEGNWIKTIPQRNLKDLTRQ